MSRPKNKYDRQHLQHLQQLQRQIDAIYQEATREAANIGASVGNFDSARPFTFSDYPLTKRRIDRLMGALKDAIEVCVVNGVNSEWTLANNKNNELANRVFGKNVGKLTQAQYRRYYSTNDNAREAFLSRKRQGLSLSDTVWRYTDEFKDEIEMGIDLGLRGGLSADQMTRELRQYLKHPDLLFRRVRDEHGMLHLSRRAAAFHPGRGVYRSSYMNARRLAATEGNIAYRTSDHERWQKMDFVVGIEIHLSNNHTCKGRDGKPHPFHDICDELAGRYPKDFKFTGWHPHCRCFATSILKTDEEIARDTQKILNGEPVDGDSVNKVKDVPQAFKDWLSENGERIKGAKSLPYFIRDNQRKVEGIINPKQTRLTPLEIAKRRHEARTKEQIDAIKKTWEKRLEEMSPLNETSQKALSANISYLDVARLEKQLEERETISKLCGGDMTKGSCSSLAFAYAGNRAGLNVTDYRGGASQDFFSRMSNIKDIATKVGGDISKDTNDYKNAQALLGKVENEKEYYFACGSHAAIVRKTTSGFEYLELQSAVQNGWKPLNNDMLKNRFCAKRSHTFRGKKYDVSGILIDVELLKKDYGFRKLLGYINTESAKQMKGKSGTIK